MRWIPDKPCHGDTNATQASPAETWRSAQDREPPRSGPAARRSGRITATLCVLVLSGAGAASALPASGSPISAPTQGSKQPATQIPTDTAAPSGTNVARPSAAFDWPVSPHDVVRLFDPPELPWGSGHRGVDLRSTVGAEVRAPSDGTVTFAGSVAGRGVLTLHHPEGFDTTYEPVSDQVPTGTAVHRGDRIATLDAGHCEPACLHWGYRTGSKTYRDPLTLVARSRPVLLPLL